MTHAASTEHSMLFAAGSRAYSLARRSVHETKDNLLLICIGLLEAIDRLQERLHLPCSLVKDLKRKLSAMVERSLTLPLASSTCATLCHVDVVSDAIADSDMWDVAKPEEVKGLVHWLLAVTTSVNRLVFSGALRVCRGVLILIMSFPGVSTACSLLARIFALVDDILGLSSALGLDDLGLQRSKYDFKTSPHKAGGRHYIHHHRTHRTHPQPLQYESYMADPSLTAVVLEYREKECMVPLSINRRIQRVMHFPIPLRSFEATVRLPPETVGPNGSAATRRVDTTTTTQTAAYAHSTSPRSIPVSPIARKRVQLAFSTFSDDVLYQARDRLRQERAATLAGLNNPSSLSNRTSIIRVPRFNPQDCNDEIYLSCGKHCATKVGQGMYRSVRATVSIAPHRLTYFEMTLTQPKSPLHRGSSSSSRTAAAVVASTATASNRSSTSSSTSGSASGPSVCVGLSTRAMPLNTLVGASKYSIGFYSVGHVLIASERRSFVSVDLGFGYDATVGVLVHVVSRADADAIACTAHTNDCLPSSSSAMHHSTVALVRFSVNGVALRDDAHDVLVFALPFPAASELFPTLTLHSQDVQVLSRFSAADITALHVEDFELSRSGGGGAATGRDSNTSNDEQQQRSSDMSDDSVDSREDDDIWCLDGLRLGIQC